ncbi:MAG: arsenic resistance protein, partial [Anaerolineae bacterium]
MLKTLQKIAKGIESNLIWLILLFIVAGIAFGWLLPAQAKGLKAYTTVALFVMLYPMMIGLRIEEVGKAAANLKLISLSMLFNFVFSPLLAAGLAFLFLRNRPDFAVGLILTGTVPCAGMVAGWTGYALLQPADGAGVGAQAGHPDRLHDRFPAHLALAENETLPPAGSGAATYDWGRVMFKKVLWVT